MPLSSNPPYRVMTELDHVRLASLLRRMRHQDALALAPHAEDMLDAIDTVPSNCVPADVVTINSEIMLRDLRGHRTQRLKVCWPEDSDPAAGRVSVLSPAGWNLLGLRVGSTARWAVANHAMRESKITAILFQPEANGQFTV